MGHLRLNLQIDNEARYESNNSLQNIMESFRDKVTLISGAGHGFGRRVAVLFAENKAKVVLADINLGGAEETAKECRKAGISEADILCVKADITKADDRSDLMRQTLDRFLRLDILTEQMLRMGICLWTWVESFLPKETPCDTMRTTLFVLEHPILQLSSSICRVNNAGIARYPTIEDTSEEMYDLVMNLNVKAHFFVSQLAIPYLKKSAGCIVNISSVVGQEAMAKGIVYCMSKAAVDSFTRALALDLAESGVRVNSIRPGVVHTGLYDNDFGDQVPKLMEMRKDEHPLGRLGTVDDIANAVAFLASDKASFITGQHLAVDGGRLCVGASFNSRARKTKMEVSSKVQVTQAERDLQKN